MLMVVWLNGVVSVPPAPPDTMGKELVAEVARPVFVVPLGAMATEWPAITPPSTNPPPGRLV
jgi:hypothetical protein